jgi:hypothetical protein
MTPASEQEMEPLALRDHVVCQSFQRFMIEALELRAQGTCTCLVKACDMICQRYPDLTPHVTIFYAQAAEFRHALSDSSQNAQDPYEHAICFDTDEKARPDSSEACPALESGTATIDKAGSLLVSGIQHMDSPDVDYIQDQHDLDTEAYPEASLGCRVISSRHV